MLRGTHHGSASGGVPLWAGGAGEPPPPSGRSVSPGLAAGQLSPRPRLSQLTREPRPRGPAREGRDGRLHRPAQPGTPAETRPPNSGHKPRLRSPSCLRPARPAPSENRPAEDALGFPRLLCSAGSVQPQLRTLQGTRLSPRLPGGQKPSSISRVHEISPVLGWA